MRVIFCGDLSICRGTEKMILEGKGGGIIRNLKNTLNASDLFIANIECPLTDSDEPMWRYFRTHKGKKAAGRFLKELGVNIGSLANNHIADYGKQGLKDTISVLEAHNIAWVGAGWSPEEARRPLIIDRGGLRVGILALAQPECSAASRLGWGAGVLEDGYAPSYMESLSKQVDIAMAYLHYGVEFSEYPTPRQVRLSRGLVDAGAKLVIGHHPHVPQGYEWYKNGFIAYSLGNFIFDMADGPHRFSRLGLMVQAEFKDNSLKDIKIIPVDTRGETTKVLAAEEKKEAERHLMRLSEVLTDSKKLNEAYYFTCRNNFDLYAGAFFHNIFKKRNWRQARDLILQQLFWPQIAELRIDLIRFLLSGNAFEIERLRGKANRDRKGHLWKWFCRISFYLGLPFRWIPGFRIL